MLFDDDDRDNINDDDDSDDDTNDDVNDDSDDGTNDDDSSSGSKDDDDSSSGSKDDDDSDDDFDKERALRTIRKLRKAEKDLKGKVKEYEDKDKSEAQKAKDDLKEARKKITQLEDELTDERVKQKAKDAGMHNPDKALKLLDLDEFDGDADAALADLKKTDPYLFKPAEDSDDTDDKRRDADSGEKTNPRRGYQGKLTIEKIRNMSPEELEKNEAAIDKFLASQ